MSFPFGQGVLRDRRPLIPDPYNPSRLVPGSWADADTVSIQGAWIASSSSTRTQTSTRVQILTEKSLFCGPGADIQPGDRIRGGGVTYFVVVKPAADTNPFTGWSPVLEVPLEEREG